MTQDQVKIAIDKFLKNAGHRIKAGESIEVVAYEIVDTFVAVTNDDYDPSLDTHYEKVFDLASYVELGPDYVETFSLKSEALISELKLLCSTE